MIYVTPQWWLDLMTGRLCARCGCDYFFHGTKWCKAWLLPLNILCRCQGFVEINQLSLKELP